MKTFELQIESLAIEDIQQAIDWYEDQQAGLGRKFYSELTAAFDALKVNPFFQIRYDQVRCLPLLRFPYMIHFTVDENTGKVVIRAVFNTAKDPQSWKRRS